MHIQFTKVRYKNILSVGNQFIEIDFEEAKTSIISGQNGSGKSTILCVITYCLFNKPFRKINKPQLLNSINKKDLVVELEFTVGASKYMIRRGMKPTIFEIWKDGELLNKDAASRDYQEYLEQSILKMSYKSFTQIVILGSATYVPFMELPAGQRRDIIEDLLDIQVFSVMNNLLKDKISSNKECIGDNNYSVDLLKNKIESAKDHNNEIHKMKQTEVNKLKIKVSENLETIETTNSAIEVLESEITELGNTILDKHKHKKTNDQVTTLLRDLQTKQKTFLREIDFYSNHDNCPTCKQGIEHDFKDNAVKEKNDKYNEIEAGLEQLHEKQNEVQKRLADISNVEDVIQKVHSKANEQRLSVKIIMGQLKNIKIELETAERNVEEIDQSKIVEYLNDLKSMQTVQTDLYEDRETLGIVGAMLKDGGIKTSIIRTYIPIMNKIINQYLSEFELFVDFNLNEDFSETIKSRFRDTFSFASFSEGEKLRISLSIMFAWRALAKLRNSVSTNLLILDEVLDGASDSSGVESLIDILKKLNASDNVFVISHRGEQFGEKFDRHLRFEKVRNFTQLAT
jgi:DNA repair exonuclease SbcCD ATPase subunit